MKKLTLELMPITLKNTESFIFTKLVSEKDIMDLLNHSYVHYGTHEHFWIINDTNNFITYSVESINSISLANMHHDDINKLLSQELDSDIRLTKGFYTK